MVNFYVALDASLGTHIKYLTQKYMHRKTLHTNQFRRMVQRVSGTTERPRLSVFRSNKHLYAQVIDDTKSCTLASASTMHKALSKELEYSAGPTTEVAQKIGEVIAKSCLEKGITKVVFDRGGFLYHGRIKALADAARENGLEF
uniref:Large ribosomal subunit protein uL18c n=1 Tax=Aegilops tauschii TaxID=37682 RepID=M8BGP3_AEGTA